MLIPILLGSKSDLTFTEKITKHLDEFGLEYKIHIASAHKVPEKVFAIVQEYNLRDDIPCYITIAGRSNGLSGVTAANSIYPVIACPPFSDKTDFLVNINSTLQMPSDTPVLTVIDPQNAAMSVIRIASLKDKKLQKKISERIENIKKSF